MRYAIAAAIALSIGCSPGLVFNTSVEMSKEEMLARATHVFVGVVQKQQYESWPLLPLTIAGQKYAEAKYYKILRRDVLIEMNLRGAESRRTAPTYEFSWTGGTTGDWNNIKEGDRALFLVRVENGRYHIVRDWWRSIFPVTTGRHTELPGDGSHPLWERIALMNYWIASRADVRITYPQFRYADPGDALGLWRTVKLQRGLVRHPSRDVRVAACRELIRLTGWGQDECWEVLSEEDRAYDRYRISPTDVANGRENLKHLGAPWFWARMTTLDERRLLTTVSNNQRRREFCALYRREYPTDFENGCPADQPPPASIVTSQGEKPLVGPWPKIVEPAPLH